MVSKHWCAALFVFIFFNGFQAASCAAEGMRSSTGAEHLATKIANDYVRSFLSEDPDEAARKVGDRKDLAYKVRPPRLGEKARRELIFNHIFKRCERYALLQQKHTPVLGEYVWKDLHLFYGSSSAPSWHLMSRIDRTVTAVGEGVLATLLVTPSSNLEELYERQRIVRAFLENETVTEALKASLQFYQKAEQSVLSLYTSSDPLYTEEYRRYMDDRFYAEGSVSSNKNAAWLEFKKRFSRDFWDIQCNFLYPAILPATLSTFFKNFFQDPEFETIDGEGLIETCWKGAIPYYGAWHRWELIRKEGMQQSGFDVPILLSEIYYTRSVYKGLRSYLEYSSVLRSLALRMADVQSFVVAATQISGHIAASPQLESLYGARLNHIRGLLTRGQENTDLGRLVGYLQTLPYHRWSYFFNNAGKLLASYKLFTEYKDAFSDAMYELGELDAFVSVATLVQEAKNYAPDHAYAFAKFLDRSQKEKPYVKFEDLWNPFIDAQVAVGNSVLMDANGGASNIILTGPNAGGKSTFLTGVATGILLSQAFGIAPAKEAIVTPFDKINTSIDITDDIAAGKSLFMAGVDRSQEHIQMLNSLQPSEFSFSIFDEPFSGTNPTEGAAAEYSILEAMANHTNALNIVATHYPIVTLLEDNCPEKGFRNYKVYVTTMDPAKRINYTYKVIPGKSNQAIAIHILEEQGYDVGLLKRAREIIEHPERYQATF